MRVADLPRSRQSSNPCAPSPSAPCFSEPRHRSGPGAGTGVYPASPPTAGPASIPATTRACEAWRSRAGRMCPFLRPFRPGPDHRPAPTPVWPSLGHIPLLFSFFCPVPRWGLSLLALSLSYPSCPQALGQLASRMASWGPFPSPTPSPPVGSQPRAHTPHLQQPSQHQRELKGSPRITQRPGPQD